MDRRAFVKQSMSAVAAVCSPLAEVSGTGITPQRILVLGGTFFLGPAFVEAATQYGHTVSLFNRGVTNPDLFPHLEKLRGFRSAEEQDLAALASRHFDVVVDVWPSDPSVAASAAQFLKDRVRHYLYVSSIAAYDSREYEKAGITEEAPLEPWDSAARKYNRGKAESERRLQSIVGDRLTVVRPGPIKGTRDTTPDLFTWLMRAQSDSHHIGPGNGADAVELVDVKDVARFLVLAIHRSLYGTFNLTGRPMTFKEFLNACNQATESDAQFEWIPQKFLLQHGLDTDSALKTFSGNFPLWRPANAQPGLFQVSSDKAFRTGWKTRAFRETALDCLLTFRARRENLDWTDYLTAEKEQAVLSAWQHRI